MIHLKSQTKAESERKYQAARSEARAIFEPEVRSLTGLAVRLRDIDEAALEAAEVWRAQYVGVGRVEHAPGWEWQKEVRRFSKRSRRVELAIWVEETLCGLALGRISDRCVVATIHLLEGSPVANPLQGKVIQIATRYLEILALAVGCREAAIDSPMPALIGRYQSVGFVKQVTRGKKVTRLTKFVSA